MGFFDRHATNKPHCISCGLDKHCKTPRMKVTGQGQMKVLIIGEAPRSEDDDKGTQFVSKSGKRLRSTLFRNCKVKLDRDCWKINAVNCRPHEKNRNITPTNEHINACRPSLMGIIKELAPKKIILLGATAIASFYSNRSTKNINITKYAGLKFWDSTHNAWVFPIYDPYYVERKNYDEGLVAYFERTLKYAIESPDKPLAQTWNPVKKLIDYREAVKYLSGILKNNETIALDWEATGLKPQPKGHQIATVGIANDKGAAAIPVEYPHWTEAQQRKIKFLVTNILKSRRVKKIVHSLGFEYAWAKEALKIEPQGFIFDTQIGIHIEDNRKGITSLKFQAFMRWGIEGYENVVTPYLTTKKGVTFNKVMKAPLEPLLQYNGEDAMYTWQIYKELQAKFDADDRRAYKLLHDGMLVMAEMHCNGIKIREDYYTAEMYKLETEKDAILADMRRLPEVREFKKVFGAEFDMNSNDDMQDLLFDIMKLDPIRETKTGYSVDEKVLLKLNVPVTKLVLKVRKISKLISTYLKGYMRETYEGLMHPWFYLDRARTYRSSSANPNFQNIPKRDERAMLAIRSGMVPLPMCLLGEADFSGAEVSTSCFYHMDKNFIRYQLTKGADMHRDAASEIWKVARNIISKKVRQATKSGFVFSEFYGSYFKDCATEMWEEMLDLKLENGVTLRDHIKTVGLDTYAKFEKNVEKFEKKFWDEWFPEYKQWKIDVYKKYVKTGMVKTLLGFKFRGYMDKKQCSNYPVQGTSFHLLISALVQLYRKLKKAGKKTKLIGQIHDSIIANIVPSELKWFRKTVGEIVRGLDKKYKWMTVPMEVELEISKLYEKGGSFAKMTEIPI